MRIFKNIASIIINSAIGGYYKFLFLISYGCSFDVHCSCVCRLHGYCYEVPWVNVFILVKRVQGMWLVEALESDY
jgi:hypothetical protein